MSKHAVLSASSTSRWLKCPGSIQASSHIIESDSGPSARLGTAAHYLGECCLIRNKDPHEFIDKIILMYKDDAVVLTDPNLKKKIYATDHKLSKSDLKSLEQIPVDMDMASAVSVYLDTVADCRKELGKNRIEYIEEYFELKKYDEELGGTGDWSAAVEYDCGIVIDYKNGSGVIVEIHDNEQLKTYGLGLLLKHPSLETIKTIIVQPRAAHEDGPVRSQTYTAQELLDFGAELKTGAEVTRGKNPPLKAGSWCKFCPILGECSAAKGAAQEQAMVDFEDDPQDLPVLVDNTDIAKALKWLPFIDNWIGKVKEHALNELAAGREVPGYKLVKKKSNRVWKKKDPVKQLIAKGKLKKKDLYTEPKILGPAGVEKLGKDKAHRKIIKELVAKMAEKPDTGNTIAAESDVRTEVNPKALAAADFDEKPPTVK